MWDTETIPDKDVLYKRIHENHIEDGEVMPITFKEQGKHDNKGMSTDWKKYSTPKETKLRARSPKKNGVVSFVTGDLRDLNLEVAHAPIKDHAEIEDNRAHTNVKGIDTENRAKLLCLIKWEIKPRVPVNP